MSRVWCAKAWLVALALAVTVALARPAAAAAIESLGRLERESLLDALAQRGLAIDPSPQEKTIENIHVVNQEVFSERDFFLPVFNMFHRTTRQNIIRREVLLRPGQRYDQKRVDETVRNLGATVLSNVVVIVPVKTSSPSTVDLLVVTRDVWSLRLNSTFEVQAQRLVFLSMSLSEDNLFGWRKTAALAFYMNQGVISLGPTYTDPNIAGTRLRLHVRASTYISRESGEVEGSGSRLRVDYPLFSLASRWGAWAAVGHSNAVVRRYLEGSLARVRLRNPAAAGADVPWTYRVRSLAADAGVVRSFGRSIIQRVSVGHDLSAVRPELLPDFPSDDPKVRDAFRAEVFPRSERISAPFISYAVFTPNYRVYRDLRAFDFRENALLGPELSATVSRAMSVLGSENDFTGLGVTASWTFDLADGYQSVGASFGARWQGDRLIDQATSLSTYVATPVLWRTVRLLASATTSFLHNDTQNRVFSLGGDTGLRAYVIGDFQATGAETAYFLGHAEMRTAPLQLAAFRMGAVAFYDVGDVATRFADLRGYQDIGGGLRFLIPHTGSYVTRLDWAFPLQDSVHTRAGWPGRISLGYHQTF